MIFLQTYKQLFCAVQTGWIAINELISEIIKKAQSEYRHLQNQSQLWKWQESPENVPQLYLKKINFILFRRNIMLPSHYLKIAWPAAATITMIDYSGHSFYTSNEISIYIQPPSQPLIEFHYFLCNSGCWKLCFLLSLKKIFF